MPHREHNRAGFSASELKLAVTLVEQSGMQVFFLPSECERRIYTPRVPHRIIQRKEAPSIYATAMIMKGRGPVAFIINL